MKAIKLISVVVFTFLFNCASTNSVISEFDETIDFDSYTTFVLCVDDLFVENIDYPNLDNNAIRQVIGDYVEAEMIKKGHKTNVLKPELQAGFQIVIEKKEDSFQNCELEHEFSYWHECTINTITYTEETLVVYVSDFSKNQIVWQASLPCNLNRSKENLNPYVKKLVEQLFNEYPKVN